MKLFHRANRAVGRRAKRDIPAGLWTKCDGCGQLLYNKALEEGFRVCSKCDFHFPLTARERLTLLADPDTFEEWDADLSPTDPLQFKGPKTYVEKLQEDQHACGMVDACITGAAQL